MRLQAIQEEKAAIIIQAAFRKFSCQKQYQMQKQQKKVLQKVLQKFYTLKNGQKVMLVIQVEMKRSKRSLIPHGVEVKIYN